MTEPLMLERADGGYIALHHLAGNGPDPLLVSHATGFHARCYLEFAAHLSNRWSVWGLDYSGHGVSPAPSQPLVDWAPFAADAVTVARHLAPDGGLRVFGHSMGGAAVLLAHLIDPLAFSELIAFEPIAPPPTDGLDPDTLPIVQGAVRRRPTFDTLDAALENYAAKRPMSAFSPITLDHYVRFGMNVSEDGRAHLSCTPAFEASVFRGAHTNQLWDQLTDIDLSVTVISGVVEVHQPSAFAAAVADRLPNGRLAPHSELDHFGPFTHPMECAHIVDGLLIPS